MVLFTISIKLEGVKQIEIGELSHSSTFILAEEVTATVEKTPF